MLRGFHLVCQLDIIRGIPDNVVLQESKAGCFSCFVQQLGVQVAKLLQSIANMLLDGVAEALIIKCDDVTGCIPGLVVHSDPLQTKGVTSL